MRLSGEKRPQRSQNEGTCSLLACVNDSRTIFMVPDHAAIADSARKRKPRAAADGNKQFCHHSYTYLSEVRPTEILHLFPASRHFMVGIFLEAPALLVLIAATAARSQNEGEKRPRQALLAKHRPPSTDPALPKLKCNCPKDSKKPKYTFHEKI